MPRTTTCGVTLNNPAAEEEAPDEEGRALRYQALQGMSEAFAFLFVMHQLKYPESLSPAEMEAFKTHIQAFPAIVDELFIRLKLGDESTSVAAFIAMDRTQVTDKVTVVRAFLQASEATLQVRQLRLDNVHVG
jgi:hypothetical protein